jgi:threonine/homoserine/homoserine lactone efflux protein
MLFGMIGFAITIFGMFVGAWEYYSLFVGARKNVGTFNNKIMKVMKKAFPILLIGLALLAVAENHN